MRPADVADLARRGNVRRGSRCPQISARGRGPFILSSVRTAVEQVQLDKMELDDDDEPEPEAKRLPAAGTPRPPPPAVAAAAAEELPEPPEPAAAPAAQVLAAAVPVEIPTAAVSFCTSLAAAQSPARGRKPQLPAVSKAVPASRAVEVAAVPAAAEAVADAPVAVMSPGTQSQGTSSYKTPGLVS